MQGLKNLSVTIYTLIIWNIADSVVLITGATSTLGKELAVRYCQRECKVVICSKSFNELKKV